MHDHAHNHDHEDSSQEHWNSSTIVPVDRRSRLLAIARGGISAVLILALAPLLKAHATETATDAVTTCTQVFGGIGFTWECDMHLYFKRAGYDRQLLGSPAELFALAAAS